jgi:HAD superfamily hydrolase (TIGR01484 family)
LMPKIQFMSWERGIKLIATDLDGTILRDDKSISVDDFTTLTHLGEAGIIRIAATGRSLHKVNEVLLPDSPFDFVVFSSGGGVYDWKEKKLLADEHFNKSISGKLCRFLVELDLNFVVFDPIPNNNLFHYHKGIEQCSEFNDYLERHKGDFSELAISRYSSFAGQFMSIIPNDEVLFNSISGKLTSAFNDIRIIRTTSPIDKRFLWLEIFPDSVSKGHGIRWICDSFKVPYLQTIGIGNDFNDIDMLDFVGHPFILGNSPFELHDKYPLIDKTNNESGFSRVVEQFINL